MLKKTKLTVLSVLMSLLLTGCGNNVSQGSDYHLITDFKNREVNVKKDVERVCITFNIEEYLAIGGEESISKIVGWSHSYWVGRREDALQAYKQVLPNFTSVPDIGYGANSTFDVEKMISLNPDVILMSASVDYSSIESSLSLLEKAGIPVVFFDYHVDTQESIRLSNKILGEVLNQEQRAEEISDFYDEEVEKVYSKVKNLSSKDKPNVYMEFSKGVNTYGNTWSKKMWGNLIGLCGGTNIAYDISDANSADMAKEAILSKDPDIIIFTGALQSGLNDNIVLGYNQDKGQALDQLEAYLKRDNWENIKAVKNRNLHAIYHDLSRHVFDFAGVQYLAKAIHPQLFSSLDPKFNLSSFFDRFMPMELNGTFGISL